MRAADRSVESERNSSSGRDAAACLAHRVAQSAAILLERFVDLGITVTVEGREVDHRLVEITVDVDTRERHEFESFILDVLEFGRMTRRINSPALAVRVPGAPDRLCRPRPLPISCRGLRGCARFRAPRRSR